MSGAPNVILVDLSGNYIGGELPETPPPFLRLKMMDLSSNSLTGFLFIIIIILFNLTYLNYYYYYFY